MARWSPTSTSLLHHFPGRYSGARVEVLESPGGELAVRCQGETIPSQLAPPRAGVLRERRSELARDPVLERVASSLGSGGAPSGRPVLPAATNGNGVAPQATGKALRPPTPRQAERWKAIEQAQQLQGLSQRATARLLGISRSTVSNYVRAGGPAGPPACGIIGTATTREDRIAAQLSGQNR